MCVCGERTRCESDTALLGHRVSSDDSQSMVTLVVNSFSDILTCFLRSKVIYIFTSSIAFSVLWLSTVHIEC